MSWKFWKRNDDLGLGKDDVLGSPNRDAFADQSGLDLSGGFSQPPAGMPGLPPMPQAASQPTQAPSSFAFQGGMNPQPQEGRVFTPADDQHGDEHGKDFEIIAAKLDTIKAQLETLSNRLANLEQRSQQQAGPQQDPRRLW